MPAVVVFASSKQVQNHHLLSLRQPLPLSWDGLTAANLLRLVPACVSLPAAGLVDRYHQAQPLPVRHGGPAALRSPQRVPHAPANQPRLCSSGAGHEADLRL